jgi:hypothetical protein
MPFGGENMFEDFGDYEELLESKYANNSDKEEDGVNGRRGETVSYETARLGQTAGYRHPRAAFDGTTPSISSHLAISSPAFDEPNKQPETQAGTLSQLTRNRKAYPSYPRC